MVRIHITIHAPGCAMTPLVSVRRLIVHHSESPGGGVAFLRHCHVDENGWADIGYHYVIGNGVAWGGYSALADGACADGRSVEYQGAHCRGVNTDSIGICVIGKLDVNEPTTAQIRGLTGLLTELCLRYNLTADDITGHRDHNATTCPGDRMYFKLFDIKRDVAAVLAVLRTASAAVVT